MKKILKSVFAIIGLLVVAIVVLPFVINVDKYRPMIVSKANEFINGKLEIGKMDLSLWGKIKVKIDGVSLKDSAGKSVLEVKDASVVIPVSGILSGSPELALELSSPQLNIVKFKNGKMNVMSLMKDSGSTAGGAESNGASGAAPSKTEAGVPAIALKSRLTFLLEHAKLAYKDELSGDAYNINDLNFSVKNISLEREMPFELMANLDLTTQKNIKITGPLILDGSLKAVLANGSFDKADLNMNLKMEKLDINDPGMFVKKPGVPLGFEMKAQVGKDEVKISKMQFILAQVVLDSKVDLKMNPEMVLNFSIDSNKIQIAKLGDLVAMIKDYGMNGEIEFDAKAWGPVSKIEYASNTKFSGIKLIHESMKQPIKMNGSIDVITNKLKDLTINMSAKEFDVAVKGMVENFSAPKFKFSMNSNDMNLDGLLKASEKAAEVRKAQAAQVTSGAGTSAASAAPAIDYNAMLAPLRENPMMAKTGGEFDFNFKKLKSTGVLIEDLKGSFQMNGLMMALKGLSMRMFGGSMKGEMTFNAKPAKPEVGTKFLVSSLNTQKMIENQVPFAKNTVKGIMSSTLNIGGNGLNPDDITSNWKGTGTLDFVDARFSTMDFGPQIRAGVIDKLPAIAKSKVKVPANLGDWKGDYKSFNTKFALNSGVFAIQSIDGKAYPNKGLDMKGGGTVNLKNYGLDLGIDMIDTYNWFNLDQYAKDKRYGHFTASPKIKGTMFSPQFDWSATAGALAKNAAEGVGKEILKEKIAGKIPGKAGDAVNKLLGGSGGGDKSGAPSAPAVPTKEDVKKGFKKLFGR